MIYNESEESHAWFIKLYFILNLIDAKLKSGIHLFNLYFCAWIFVQELI